MGLLKAIAQYRQEQATKEPLEFVEVLEVEEPVINVRRHVNIVYSTDNMASTLAASAIRNSIQQHGKDLLKTYHIDITEISQFDDRKAYDAYVWLGMEVPYGAIHPALQGKFREAEHYTNAFNAERPVTDLDEWLTDFLIVSEIKPKFLKADAVLPTTVFLMLGEPTEGVDLHTPVIGPVWNAFCAVQAAIPELEFDDPHKLYKMCGVTDSIHHSFLSKDANKLQITHAWSLMHRALIDLEQPSYKGDLDGCVEKRYEAFEKEYAEAVSLINKSAAGMHVQYDKSRADWADGRYVKNVVVVTSMSQNFWVARRVIALAGRGFHNTRITAFGVHCETSLADVSRTSKVGAVSKAG